METIPSHPRTYGGTTIPRFTHLIAWRLTILVVMCAAITMPAGAEAHDGIYHNVERSLPGGLSVLAIVVGLIVGLALLSVTLSTSTAGWSRRKRLLATVAGVAIMTIPISGVTWSFAAYDGNGLTLMQLGDEHLADAYSSEYGGLVTPHHFGQGKTVDNPPDILEAGGYMVDLTFTTDGQSVDYITLQTLHGKRFDLFIRPEIVPVNWNTWELQVYLNCHCMVAIHFTEQDIGKVAIVLFEVSNAQYD
jgi:hypothetical protein